MSGAAGLIYEVAWTRMLALRLGHTTAAAATVAGAFMGGLALGAALGGRLTPRLSPRRALHFYAAAELLVIVVALTLPWQLEAATPLLRTAYGHGAPGWTFALVRGAIAFALLLVPAIGLGATFPLAVRARAAWGGTAGALYAVNTLGAAIGATSAGFVLLPSIGLWGTTLIGASLTASAMGGALRVAKRAAPEDEPAWTQKALEKPASRRERARTSAMRHEHRIERWVAMSLAALTGFAGFVLEIGWTRVFALVAGPSAYAFAATLACFISGLALGALAGERLRIRLRDLSLALGLALGAAALLSAIAALLAGTWLPQRIAADLAASTDTYLTLLTRHLFWTGGLVLPTAVFLGMAFPMLLDSLSSNREPTSGAAAAVYAVNTAAGVMGSLTAGFVLLPTLGIHGTLSSATALLALAAVVPCVAARPDGGRRLLPLALPLAAVAVLAGGGPWNRALLASGAYKYARYLPADGDLEAMLTAGDLRYYRDGASVTVAVRELAGIRMLAIDGKVDASSGGDMTTQKVLAHLPLLLHPDPKQVLVVGLGSGVTAGAALTHPVDRVDVVEISPEVVEASAHFTRENDAALADPRTRLIVGDGRSHLLLTGASYDVIVSEPSNPWMAGVAALFTQEFFEAARSRLARGGVLCQWAHTYDISSDDLRSIVATFASVFPKGTMWLLGEGDLLLVGSDAPLADRIRSIEAHWTRPGVAADLARARVLDPFSLMSTYAGGPAQLAAFADGAAVQRDDRMALEYSGPRALNSASAEAAAGALAALQEEVRTDPGFAPVLKRAGAEQWRRRGAMMLASDAFGAAYSDFDRALSLDPDDLASAEGFVRAGIGAGRASAAAERLSMLAQANPQAGAPLVGLSKLHAGLGQFEDAARAALKASTAGPPTSDAFAQLASVYADAGDADSLATVVAGMRSLFPDARATVYYAAALSFLQGDLPAAQRLAEQAAQADSSYAPAHNLRGAIYASVGEFSRARDAFRLALTLDPRDTSIYANLGRLEAGEGNATAAARLFAEALTLDPYLAPAKEGLAEIRRR